MHELRQRFVDMTLPQAEVLGVTLPDPELALDPATGHHRSGVVGTRPDHAPQPAEAEAGYALTCQALPVSDAITADFDA